MGDIVSGCVGGVVVMMTLFEGNIVGGGFVVIALGAEGSVGGVVALLVGEIVDIIVVMIVLKPVDNHVALLVEHIVAILVGNIVDDVDPVQEAMGHVPEYEPIGKGFIACWFVVVPAKLFAPLKSQSPR